MVWCGVGCDKFRSVQTGQTGAFVPVSSRRGQGRDREVNKEHKEKKEEENRREFRNI